MENDNRFEGTTGYVFASIPYGQERLTNTEGYLPSIDVGASRHMGA